MFSWLFKRSYLKLLFVILKLFERSGKQYAFACACLKTVNSLSRLVGS